MTKELEALEALYKLEMRAVRDENTTVVECEQLTKIIETTLKRNVELEKGIKTLEKKCNRYQKKLEALYIIKEKSVSVGIIQMSPNLDVYNNRIIEHPNVIKTKKLTQEEFDLLKEVLRNDE